MFVLICYKYRVDRLVNKVTWFPWSHVRLGELVFTRLKMNTNRTNCIWNRIMKNIYCSILNWPEWRFEKGKVLQCLIFSLETVTRQFRQLYVGIATLWLNNICSSCSAINADTLEDLYLVVVCRLLSAFIWLHPITVWDKYCPLPYFLNSSHDRATVLQSYLPRKKTLTPALSKSDIEMFWTAQVQSYNFLNTHNFTWPSEI